MGYFIEQFKKNLLKNPDSPASKICRIEPLTSDFADSALDFSQEMYHFHNPLPISLLDTIRRVHDSLEFYANHNVFGKGVLSKLETKPYSDQVGASPCKQKTPRPKSEGFLRNSILYAF